MGALGDRGPPTSGVRARHLQGTFRCRWNWGQLRKFFTPFGHGREGNLFSLYFLSFLSGKLEKASFTGTRLWSCAQPFLLRGLPLQEFGPLIIDGRQDVKGIF